MDKNLFETFMQGFHTRNVGLIYEAYISITEKGIQVAKVYQRGYSLCFHFTDPDGNVFMVCQPPEKS